MMGKLFLALLSTLLTFASCYPTLASTMGVNVSEGKSLTLEIYSQEDMDFGPWLGFDYGVNDNLKLSLGYQGEGDDNEDAFDIGGRYEIVNNLAATVKYVASDDADATTVGLRGKLPLTEGFALTGKTEYTFVDRDSNQAKFTAQGELLLAEGLYATVGGYSGISEINDEDDSFNGYLLGIEYSLSNLCFYLDYDKNNDAVDGFITLGCSYSF